MAQQKLGFENSSVVQKVQQDALAKLAVTGCFYIVIMPNGERLTHDPEGRFALPGKRKKAHPKHPHGAVSSFIRHSMFKMAPGDLVELQHDTFSLQDMQSSATSQAGKWWGLGSVATTMNRKTNCVEVLRLK